MIFKFFLNSQWKVNKSGHNVEKITTSMKTGKQRKATVIGQLVGDFNIRIPNIPKDFIYPAIKHLDNRNPLTNIPEIPLFSEKNAQNNWYSSNFYDFLFTRREKYLGDKRKAEKPLGLRGYE